MKDVYRNDYSNYANNFHRYICYGDLQHYKNTVYGSYGLAFYFSGFYCGSSRTFESSPNDVVNRLTYDVGCEYIHGHIINSELDGNLEKENLVPLTQKANRQHSTIENRVKTMITNLKMVQKKYGKTFAIGYEVIVNNVNNIPNSIGINIDVFYIGSFGFLYKYGNSQELSQYLLFPSWGMGLPYNVYIFN